MDHGGQLEREGRVMSHVQVGGVDLCDNLPNPEALAAQTRNLNETNTLAQTQCLSPSQNEEGGELTQKPSVDNNGKDMEDVQGKEGYTVKGREDEEEDIDEVMKEGEEEEESEESSCLIRCQSPDTPMTDSSYSETGSLLETPFSPGTSPEPTSPVVLVVSPETAYPTSQVELSQSNVKVDSHNSEPVASTTGSITLGPTVTTGPIDSTTLTLTSDTRPTSLPGPTCITEATDRTEHLTSSTEPDFNHGPTCTRGFVDSYAGLITSTAETFTVTACTKRLNTSIASTPMSATTGPLTFTTGLTTTGTESTTTTRLITSNWEHITSTPVPTCLSVSTCATGSIPNPVLLESLGELAQRGDDAHLPQYLHQIAEAFVLHKDYQRALRCIQLERLYHQRVLDNLNALQEQWESQCRSPSSNLATQHLDTLTNICQTHSRPGARDAVCATLDLLRPAFEEGALPSCTSAHTVDEEMEQRSEDSSSSQSSHPVVHFMCLTDGLNSPEISEKGRGDPEREVKGRDCFHGDQLSDRRGSDGEGGEAEGGVGYTISVTGNELRPSSAGEMDRSKPAEQQGGDLGPAQEKKAKRDEEERDVEEAAETVEMEEEGEEEEEEESQKEGDSPLCQTALPVETLISGAEVEAQQLHQEVLAEETQESAKTCLHQEACLPQEANMKKQEQVEEGKKEEEDEEKEEYEEYEEYEYEVQQADIIREAASLDDMAKLITVEEMSPASGLVSILKKRHVYEGNVSVSSSSETQADKIPAKRRVHFKVPDDGYEQDVGSGDSCLLLFLLCLVTVVISVGGTALYCALGDAHSSVCQDFSRNADFYIGQIQRGVAQIQHWFAPGS